MPAFLRLTTTPLHGQTAFHASTHPLVTAGVAAAFSLCTCVGRYLLGSLLLILLGVYPDLGWLGPTAILFKLLGTAILFPTLLSMSRPSH